MTETVGGGTRAKTRRTETATLPLRFSLFLLFFLLLVPYDYSFFSRIYPQVLFSASDSLPVWLLHLHLAISALNSRIPIFFASGLQIGNPHNPRTSTITSTTTTASTTTTTSIRELSTFDISLAFSLVSSLFLFLYLSH